MTQSKHGDLRGFETRFMFYFIFSVFVSVGILHFDLWTCKNSHVKALLTEREEPSVFQLQGEGKE